MTNHEIIVEQFSVYLEEHAKLTEKGIKASAARARKAIQTISKAGKERRKEIMEEKAAIGS
jgi:hypothetical protein